MADHAAGIDIPKSHPDAFRLEDAAAKQFENTARGFRALIRRLGKAPVARIVFGPAGAHRRAFEAAISGKFPRVLVKPLQARRFAGACGAQAGTDAAEARIPARMGAALALEPDAPVSPELRIPKELQVARRAPAAERTRLRNRGHIQIQALAKRRAASRLALARRQVADLDAEIAGPMAKDGTMARYREIPCSIPGLGPVATALIPTFLPGIGKPGGRQALPPSAAVPASGKAGPSSAGAASRCGMRSACLPSSQCAATLASRPSAPSSARPGNPQRLPLLRP
nr:transposase [Mangrovicoccus sp. HB161399]